MILITQYIVLNIKIHAKFRKNLKKSLFKKNHPINLLKLPPKLLDTILFSTNLWLGKWEMVLMLKKLMKMMSLRTSEKDLWIQWSKTLKSCRNNTEVLILLESKTIELCSTFWRIDIMERPYKVKLETIKKNSPILTK